MFFLNTHPEVIIGSKHSLNIFFLKSIGNLDLKINEFSPSAAQANLILRLISDIREPDLCISFPRFHIFQHSLDFSSMNS